MDLLRIIHDDFTLTVESTQFQRMWDKGLGFLGRERLFSTYHWSEGVQKVVLMQEGTEQEITKDASNRPAVFFEQTDYSVWVDFNKTVTKSLVRQPTARRERPFLMEGEQTPAGRIPELRQRDWPCRHADRLHSRRGAETLCVHLRCHLSQAGLPPRLENYTQGH